MTMHWAEISKIYLQINEILFVTKNTIGTYEVKCLEDSQETQINTKMLLQQCIIH